MHPLQPHTAYHIFNHANGFENIFKESENFRFFLEKYSLHIEPIAETYAYCLMPNHFHIVVKIKDRTTIASLMLAKREGVANSISNSISPFPKLETLGKVDKIELENDTASAPRFSDKEIELFLSKQFANLFSSYTQSFNKMYHRMGSLFIKNFKREPINDHNYLLQAIVYTHRNPVHHHFCNTYEEWDASSYIDITQNASSLVNSKTVIDLFGDLNNFKNRHTISLNKIMDID
jgi:REP element-mobilizing transposase RayT